MKKSFSALSAMAVLMLGLAVFFASCGGGGGGGGSSSSPTITPISTPTQGAQSATAAVSTFRAMSNTGSSLTGFANLGGVPLAPKMIFGAGAVSTPADKFASRFAPAAKKAQAMRASATGYPISTSCETGATVAPGTNNSMTMDMDASGTSISMTFNNCKDGGTLTDGAIVIYGDQNANSASLTIGTDAHPFVTTTYSSSTSTVVNDVATAVVTMAVSATDPSAANQTFTMVMNGYFDDVDHVAHTHEKQVMSNLSFGGALAGSSTTIGGVSYDVATLTLNGTVTGTTYASDTDQTISYQEGPNSFYNVVIVDKHPVLGTGDEYVSIDGMITISTTPADRCIDGTFSIATNTPVQIDGVTGQTKAGRMTINGNVEATFNSDGSISISIDGGASVAYSQAELDSMCSL